MPMKNLTGVVMPSVWGDLNLAGSTLTQLAEEEALKRKKKLMGAATGDEFQTATQFLFGNHANGYPKV